MPLSTEINNILAEVKKDTLEKLTTDIYSFLVNEMSVDIKSEEYFRNFIHNAMNPVPEKLYKSKIFQKVILEQNVTLLNHIADFKGLNTVDRTGFINKYNCIDYCLVESTAKDSTERQEKDIVKSMIKIKF
jgi:hypothetical protein